MIDQDNQIIQPNSFNRNLFQPNMAKPNLILPYKAPHHCTVRNDSYY